MAGSMAGLVDARYARRVAEGLLTCGAFTVDLRMPRERWFRWKSGITAPFGCDCRQVNAFPVVRRLIDGAMADAVRQAFPDAGYVVGIAQAGIPWAKTLAERLDLPLAYVRTQSRAPGGPLVECAPRGTALAIVVEDVVASGETTRRAIHAISAETDLTVAGIQSIANWDFPRASRPGAVACPGAHQLPVPRGLRAGGGTDRRRRLRPAQPFLPGSTQPDLARLNPGQPTAATTSAGGRTAPRVLGLDPAGVHGERPGGTAGANAAFATRAR